MRKKLFKILARVNKAVLPSFTKRRLDLSKSSKWQMMIFGYRLWVTKNALD
ncbi:MAG: SsrA-binding protein [Nonlabens sp.]|uniref:SsrA-binding protein n=1 Tax=Nonlabens sp. TaxID=1888209 RepID=UPI003EFA31B7